MNTTTNTTIATILNRKSVRAYESKPIEPELKQQIIDATLRSPTAGNMMLYSIIEVTLLETTNTPAINCDTLPVAVTAWDFLLFCAN